MNILYIAQSCSPYNGSEDKIGWNVPVTSAKTNRVFVITREDQRKYVEKYLEENPLQNISFYFVDIPRIYKKFFRGFMYSGRLNIWNRRVMTLAREICESEHIEIIHQITPIEFRAIGNYGKIDGVKFVCGPLGGAEFMPDALKDYSKGHKLVELFRYIVNRYYRFKFRLTGKLKTCDHIMFANKETAEFLYRGGCNIDEKTIVEVAIDENDILQQSKPWRGICHFLVAGRVIYRKGHELLLDALETFPDDMQYECTIVGEGADIERIKERCRKSKKLSAHVKLTGKIPFIEMGKEYQEADVLVMPSLRETTGSVLLEAMSKGIPVVTIDRFGGSTLVDNDSGWLYDGDTKEDFINNLASAMMECIKNPNEIKRRGKNARKKAALFTWAEKDKYYQDIYRSLL